MNMEIKSFKKLKNNRYQVFFSDKTNTIFFDEIILKNNLLVKKEISKEKIILLIKENKSLESFYDALKYVSYKNRSKKEIENYLLKRNYDKDNICKTIKKLEENKLINEDMFLDAFIHDEILLTSHGPLKIKKKLLELGFNENIILEKINAIDENIWIDKINKLAIKKINANHKDSQKMLKEKIINYFLNEGYAKNLVLSVLNNISFDNNDSIIENISLKLYKKLSLKYQDNLLWNQLKLKLISKGFSYSDVENAINKLKETL